MFVRRLKNFSCQQKGYFTDIDEGRPGFLDLYYQKGVQEAVRKEEPRSAAIDRIETAKYESLKKKLTFRDNVYHTTKLRPKIFSYRFLAPLPDIPASVFPKSQRLQLWIPNTLVYDGESAPFWVFSKDGYVYRVDNFTNTQAANRLGSVNKYELVAVSRTVFLDFCPRFLTNNATHHPL